MSFRSLALVVGGLGVVAACVGSDPSAVVTPSADDAGPNDRADSGTDPTGKGCTPNAGVACVGAGSVDRCNAAGTNVENVGCDRGCVPTPTPHCQRITPTGIAPADDFDTPDVLPTSIGTAKL